MPRTIQQMKEEEPQLMDATQDAAKFHDTISLMDELLTQHIQRA